MKRKLDVMSITGLILAIGLNVMGITLTNVNNVFKISPINLKSFYDLPSIAIV
jgi:hypothetical protein